MTMATPSSINDTSNSSHSVIVVISDNSGKTDVITPSTGITTTTTSTVLLQPVYIYPIPNLSSCVHRGWFVGLGKEELW